MPSSVQGTPSPAAVLFLPHLEQSVGGDAAHHPNPAKDPDVGGGGEGP